MGANSVRDFLGQLRPRAEHVSVARNELASVAADNGQRAESIELRLEDTGVVIEGFRDLQKPHGRVYGHRAGLSYRTASHPPVRRPPARFYDQDSVRILPRGVRRGIPIEETLAQLYNTSAPPQSRRFSPREGIH
jgi:hypothetical protein